jgi:hypothetical protein
MILMKGQFSYAQKLAIRGLCRNLPVRESSRLADSEENMQTFRDKRAVE